MAKAKAAEGETPIKKTDAVRQALADGVDNPTEAVAHIKKKFGIDITAQQFSTYKSNLKAKGAGSSGGKRTAKPSGTGIGNGRTARGALDVVDAASAVKELCNQIGADKVKRLAGLFE
jgi:hypothetical protein